MNISVELKERKNLLEKTKWLGVLAFLSAALLSKYLVHLGLNDIFQDISSYASAIIALGLFFITERGKKVSLFFVASRLEIRKIIWPSRQKTLSTTLSVIFVTAFISTILWGLDGILVFIISFITRLRFL